jgi:CheY-like chemotaxis protein
MCAAGQTGLFLSEYSHKSKRPPLKLETPNAPAELVSRGPLMPDKKQFRILSFGYEPVLMTVRALLLRKAGYRVQNTFSRESVMRHLDSGEFHLVIICHTVPSDEQNSLIASIRRLRPGLRVVCLSPLPAPSRRGACAVAATTAPEFLDDIEQALLKQAS